MTNRTATVDEFTTIQSLTQRTVTKDQIIYWTTTGIMFGVMVWSAINFAFNPAMAGAFAHLGLPNWFRWELTTAKFVGAWALLIPMVPHRIKEFAYAGFAITLVSASIAHLSSGDPVYYPIAHLAFLGSLVVSYLYYHKRIGGVAAL
jgi:DoxX-like family